jgi:hypothetical protein
MRHVAQTSGSLSLKKVRLMELTVLMRIELVR